MNLNIAILGASGFIGSRLIEILHLNGIANVRPVVRSYSSLCRLSRFSLDWRMVDACDESGLISAFNGCDQVVNLIVADSRTIVENAIISYKAAQAAGVKRMIFMSSASVHGQAPLASTDELSTLHTRHSSPYINSKVCAERALLSLRKTGSVELTILRPGIVYGPRSRWMTEIADQLLSGTAYLINDGIGVCNSIYVDNLIHAIILSLTAPTADRNVFLLGDLERITWFYFYQQIAISLGLDMTSITRLTPPHFAHGYGDMLKNFYAGNTVQKILPLIPSPFKAALKGAINALTPVPKLSPWLLPAKPTTQVTEEYSALHQCSVQLPWLKAASLLDYQPQISFTEGMKRSIAWLRFAGYPVR